MRTGTGRPPRCAWEVAGGLFVAGTTAYAAVRAVLLKPGDTVVIASAAGGVGSLAVQLATLAGLIADGQLEVPIAAVYPLAQVSDAYREFGGGVCADNLRRHVRARRRCLLGTAASRLSSRRRRERDGWPNAVQQIGQCAVDKLGCDGQPREQQAVIDRPPELVDDDLGVGVGA